MTSPLLTLSTLAPERPTIEIDAVAYPLHLPGDFGLMDHARLARLLEQVDRQKVSVEAAQAKVAPEAAELRSRLAAGPDPDAAARLQVIEAIPEAEAEALEKLLRDMTGLVLEAPPEVIAKLRDRQHLAIFEAFRQVVGTTTPPRTMTRRRSTSGSSSRRSPRSTGRSRG